MLEVRDTQQGKIQGRSLLIPRRLVARGIRRFHAKWVENADSGCWEWQGNIQEGYGKLWWGRTMALAHRVSWLLHTGEDPVGDLVLHSCDNPACVNPDHLRTGSPRDNSADKAERERHRWVLTPDVAREADALLDAGVSATRTAKEVGVSRAVLRRYIRERESA